MWQIAIPSILANLLMASAEGRLMQFVRSEFKKPPTAQWNEQWQFLSHNMLEPFGAQG